MPAGDGTVWLIGIFIALTALLVVSILRYRQEQRSDQNVQRLEKVVTRLTYALRPDTDTPDSEIHGI